MFIGHYAVSLALKAKNKKTSLGLLFIAVQFVDIVFFPLTLLGIERFTLIENYTDATHFRLDYMPFSHSLFATFLWSLIAILFLSRFLFKSKWINKKAVFIGIAILSHWFLDLIVHTADLPLLSDSSIKVGFGLWNDAVLTYILEAVLILTALFYYLKVTQGNSKIGKWGMVIFTLFLLVVNIANLFGPYSVEDTQTSTAISAIIAYSVFAAFAHWLDKKRH